MTARRRGGRRELLVGLRVAVLVGLAAAPLAMGAVHEPAFVPLLILAAGAGLYSFWRARRKKVWGQPVPPLPGGRLLLALHLLVLVQLLPLPPGLLAAVSPGSFAHYDQRSLIPLTAWPLTSWRPISVNPADSARGLAFLAAFSLLCLAVFREFDEERWRRRLAWVVVGAGAVLTLIALLQAASLHPTVIYGLWRPRWDWGVFGPYVSRNHFAGYMEMAVPLGLAFAAESFLAFREDWRRQRVGWLALSGAAGNAFIRRGALAMLLVVGLLASQSRGGLLALVVSVTALALAFRQRRQAAVVVLAVVLAGLAWVEMSVYLRAFEQRGVRRSRLALWADTLPMIPRFPLLGSGFNTFGTAYIPYQTQNKLDWHGEAHNEYLQALLDTGIVGAALVAGLLVILFRRAIRAAPLTPLDAGRLASLLALCLHNLVEFQWQIPANAATFAALAGVALRRGDPALQGWRSILTPPGRDA